MQHDKKMVAGTLHFVLPTAIGATAIVDDVTEEEMQERAEEGRVREVEPIEAQSFQTVLFELRR